MRNTKRRIEPLSFFDHTGISAHLEKMADKGWMLEKIANTGWVYRRIEPKKVHFAVSYYPKASEFDPEPSEDQKMFHEFCAHADWKLACTSAQMQIFYNERENPVPIETEPELELQAIHASAKKSFIPSMVVLLGVVLLNGGMWVSNLLGDPIDLLSDSVSLFTGFAWILLGIVCMVELGCYVRWYSKAKVAAEHGEFLQSISTSKFQKVVLVIILGGAVIWMADYIIYGDRLRRWVTILMCIYMPTLFVIVNGTKDFLKRQKASRNVNRVITITVSFVMAFGMMGLITFGMIFASNHGWFADKGEETYEHGGTTWVLHQDALPLVVEDLVEIDYQGYVKERRNQESLLLGQLVMRQRPRLDAADYADIPQLDYIMTIVKVPALYGWCKESLLSEREMSGAVREREYMAVEAEPWGASEAYRLHDSDFGARNQYLLCYDGVIVEIWFDWEPTKEQMGVVKERLVPRTRV